MHTEKERCYLVIRRTSASSACNSSGYAVLFHKTLLEKGGGLLQSAFVRRFDHFFGLLLAIVRCLRFGCFLLPDASSRVDHCKYSKASWTHCLWRCGSASPC